MKGLLIIFFVFAIACSKKNGSGDYCWRCHVTGGFPYQDRYVDTCTQNENPAFGWEDANGNDLNSFCQRK